MKRSILVLLVAAAVTVGFTTSVRAQQTQVTPGAFCSPEGATGTTADGTAMLCTRAAGEDQPRWRAAGATQQTQVPAGATTPTTAVAAATTTSVDSTAMPRTGKASGETAAVGFGVVLLGALALWWGRPRLVAFFAGPRVIEQDRIERASQLLGWSEPWEHHLDKPYWLRRDPDEAP